MLRTLLLILKTLHLTLHQVTTHIALALTPRLHRLTYRTVRDPKNIVVIGASFAGYHAARVLASTLPTGYRVVVIERNSHFQLTWVLPRFCVVAGHEHKAFIPYRGYLAPVAEGAYTWITGAVRRIVLESGAGEGKVVLEESGEEIAFEYLVVATGAVAAGLPSRVGGRTKEEGMVMLSDEQERTRTARDVVVLGGGAAGVEMAGDVKERYPEKNVTLVHSRKRLLNRGHGEGLSRSALDGLQALGVKVLLGERVVMDDQPERMEEVKLESGQVVKCDCLVGWAYVLLSEELADGCRSNASGKGQTQAWWQRCRLRPSLSQGTSASALRCSLWIRPAVGYTQLEMWLRWMRCRMLVAHFSRRRWLQRTSCEQSRARLFSSTIQSGGKVRQS
ncbi:FAD/NAD(P)-binding domain-containing protein [Aspergillus brunneoviolaceus CBS 621.78]|uniref:FAD/NAD(P)-binding domain-containing protein n=1 Tax=Aspergillus brunneoviolaceus CBS 621.78 TaxID=1450534 RepID=A0ACD1GJ44_9EURO|nr:FAD/NAD(P)-binding domain-containing protein [Aspergillus brunneoviolaceus CBS 621.78]RAH49281.1 FAD/NAD(P)-binding domain-containing protein [Aspergillus brunneoviolaceus CBS 621.78]